MKLQLAASFDMKDQGDLHYFLGIEVIRTPEGILISQRHYVLRMLFKFGMADCKSVSTPLDRTVKLKVAAFESLIVLPLIIVILLLGVCGPSWFFPILGFPS